jgi:hypothetical protein
MAASSAGLKMGWLEGYESIAGNNQQQPPLVKRSLDEFEFYGKSITSKAYPRYSASITTHSIISH